jgi:adenylate kinase
VTDKYRTVLLFGAPGAGKGTQGNMLGSIPGFHHFSTGDMFRNLDPHSQIGQTFLGYSTKGELVPDELTVELWRKNIEAQHTLGLFRPHHDMLVLDGIPRSAHQTSLMDEHIRVLGIIVLEAADPQQMLTRLRRRAQREGRPDDGKESVIRRRLEVYAAETQPVLDRYPGELVHRIDAIGSPARVLERVLDILAPIQESSFPNALA